MTDPRVAELLQPTALFRSLADASPTLLWISAPDGGRILLNRAWLTFRGRTLADELGDGWLDGVHDDDRLRVIEACLNARHHARPFTMEYRLLCGDGPHRWVSDRAVPWLDSSGSYLGHAGVCTEVTNQNAPSQSEDQLRQLAASINAAREEERSQVARELHDELGQTLTALKLDISCTVAGLEPERLTPGIVDRLQSLVGLSDIALAMVKRIATRLRPPALDHLGLAEAIHWEAMAVKARTELRCQVRANRKSTNITAAQQTALFRIFQEALTNIVRHAQASAVQVTLDERDGQAVMRIRDNGCGITSTQAANPHAIGLVGMRERANLIGGTFAIEGHRGKGTVVTVRVPTLKSQDLARASRVRKRSSTSR